MAKTITQLEPSDIDTKGNDVHKALLAGLAVSAIVLSSPRKDDESADDRVQRVSTNAIAFFINFLNESGYVISKKEDIPSAFIGE